ncbi:MAG: hypothetical protein GY861_07390 [bacterium]|nr:hypothetical protein [bacterium]
MNKKAQMRMFEVVAVIVIFFALVGFGLVFYANMQKDATEFAIKEWQEARAVRIAKTISELPELKCNEDIAVQNCVDLLKAEKLEGLLNDPDNADLRDHYFAMFGYSTMVIKEVYPETITEDIEIYSKSKPRWNSILRIQIPISLYHPTDSVLGNDEGTVSFAYLEVNVYA